MRWFARFGQVNPGVNGKVVLISVLTPGLTASVWNMLILWVTLTSPLLLSGWVTSAQKSEWLGDLRQQNPKEKEW